MEYKAITGRIKATTAVHVGAGRENQCTDAPCRRDSRGRWVIPGSAVAGTLRSLATRLAPRFGHGPCAALINPKVTGYCGCRVCQLFGEIKPGPDMENNEEQGSSSRVRFYDAPLKDMPGSPLIRDMVGISRYTNTASATAKFDAEVLPAGTTFCFRIELDSREEQEQCERLLAAALSEWQQGRGFIGGLTARGLGAFILEEVVVRGYNLNDGKGLMDFLRDDTPWENGQEYQGYLPLLLEGLEKDIQSKSKKPPYSFKNFVQVKFPLQFEGPFLVSDSSSAGLTRVDHAPLLASMHHGAKPVLPGSSLRGALRSHAGKIARTLSYHRDGPEGFKSSCPACDPLEKDVKNPLASCDAFFKDNRYISEDDSYDTKLCLACLLFGSTRAGSRLIIKEAELAESYNPDYKLMDFLAVDRFTGGGKDGAKFDALALWRPTFEGDIIMFNPTEWELGWLALVLRDLAAGHISLGFGSSKGFGKVTVPGFKLSLGYLDNSDLEELNVPIVLQSGAKSGICSVVNCDTDLDSDRENLLEICDNWVNSFINKVNSFTRGQDMELKIDYNELSLFYPLPGVIASEK